MKRWLILTGVAAALVGGVGPLTVGSTVLAANQSGLSSVVHPTISSQSSAAVSMVVALPLGPSSPSSSGSPNLLCQPGGTCGTFQYFDPGIWWVRYGNGQFGSGNWEHGYSGPVYGCLVGGVGGSLLFAALGGEIGVGALVFNCAWGGLLGVSG